MVELTPAGIVTTLSGIAKRIDEKADEIAQLDALATAARAKAKREYAREFLNAVGSNDVKRYTAELATASLTYEADVAEQVLRAGRESLRVLRDRLEVGRSLSAIMRLEWAGRD